MATIEHCLYCFEALDASLSKRTPMTLYQVQTSWAEYPKGLEVEGEVVEVVDGEAEEEDEDEAKPTSSLSAARNPTLSRLSERSGTSSPSSNSSISLAPSTVATTPESSTSSFTPIGIGRLTSQHNDSITESPLFVTWNTMSSSGFRSLRGCIGTFEAQRLSEGLSSYSLTSALHDTRFNPITLSELPTLEVSVTLLTDFEQAKDAMDWELGVHGLRISFYYRNRRHGACYLPDVAPEQGWDKEETVISLMRKAGWGGKRERWNEVGDLKVVRFQGKAESLDWAEFRDWRAWVEKGGNGK